MRRHGPSAGASLATGTWLVKEIRARETWQDNLAHPVAAMLYGNSVASCRMTRR
jgi:hypothetical protein